MKNSSVQVMLDNQFSHVAGASVVDLKFMYSEIDGTDTKYVFSYALVVGDLVSERTIEIKTSIA